MTIARSRLRGSIRGWSFILASLWIEASAVAAGLESYDQVIVYPSLVRAVPAGWEIRLHGLVFEPERRALLQFALRSALGVSHEDLSTAQKKIFKQRTGYFFVDDERGKKLTLTLRGQEFSLGSSAANGHFETTAMLRSNVWNRVAPANADTNFLLEGLITLRAGGSRAVPVELILLHETGVSVISDIDDTIKVSEVRKKNALVMNTFCRPFQPVPGMAEVYRRWSSNGAQFHYVTASPWQLYVPLEEFVRDNGFPHGSFEMKSFRFKDTSFFSLFTSPERYKPAVIERLMKQYPRRSYVLVGDSGEKDPEIYGALARKHPQQVLRILIRNVTDENKTAVRYQKAFRDIPGPLWQVFEKPEEIEWAPGNRVTP